ncbi:MAG: type I methionyl aminopeptidase [Acidimicrobiia bacterium]|nr:type I methionyl aminopeptidase [Acidimicrobiia bacterium]
MRRAGRVVAEMHHDIRALVAPGVTTAQLDAAARAVLERRGATSNFLGYHGFPAVICASVNEVAIHGIPDDTPLVDGDLLSVDCGAVVDGWHGDAAFTMGVGPLDPTSARLVEVADAALAAGIATLVPGGRVGDYGAAVAATVHGAGFSVLADYVGHGIGTAMHEPPDIPNEGRRGRGPKLRVGATVAVEPMLTAGGPDSVVLDDGWAVATCDGSRAAHVEHTVAIGEDGPEILTRLP